MASDGGGKPPRLNVPKLVGTGPIEIHTRRSIYNADAIAAKHKKTNDFRLMYWRLSQKGHKILETFLRATSLI